MDEMKLLKKINRITAFDMLAFALHTFNTILFLPGNTNRKGKWHWCGMRKHCFANEFVITNAHSFGTDTQNDYSQGNCRIMSSIIIKLVERVVYCTL